MEKERIYIRVNLDIDATGYMVPKSIEWKDGRTFIIDEVASYRPAAAMQTGRQGDCYIVKIRGEEKALFFERTDPRLQSRIGRWYIEKSVAS